MMLHIIWICLLDSLEIAKLQGYWTMICQGHGCLRILKGICLLCCIVFVNLKKKDNIAWEDRPSVEKMTHQICLQGSLQDIILMDWCWRTQPTESGATLGRKSWVLLASWLKKPWEPSQEAEHSMAFDSILSYRFLK